ncbi:cytochrome P450 [Pararhodobacter sp.]|uniref:cytochrome P450 n=1 Tax=Pararhodobacter sp. TaxID=2127056 RepID=UPI002B002A62|nr:cytochrome P450 [Pararhodobacter sp.]
MTDATSQGCPVDHQAWAEFRPHEHVGMAAFFEKCRAESPVFFDSGTGYWIVTRRDDVRAVFSDPDTYSALNVHDPVRPFPPEVVEMLKDAGFTRDRTQANCDRPRHTRIRKASQSFLNLRQFKAREGVIAEMVAEAVAKLHGQSRVDLVDALTYELPARVLFLLLGVPDVNARKIKTWADSRFKMISGDAQGEELMEAAREAVDLWNFCGELIEARKKKPGDDYPSHLLALHAEDPESITANEIHNLTYGVLLAGHETTTNAMGSILRGLLDDRSQWERLVADPSLIKNAVEEGLRAMPPVVSWRRKTTRAVTLSGVDIPEGAGLLMSLVSANRDENHFGEAETLEVDRADARDHVSFGYGIHFCLGANLARLEIAALLQELVRVFPNMALVPGSDPGWHRTMLVRGPSRVLVDLNEA